MCLEERILLLRTGLYILPALIFSVSVLALVVEEFVRDSITNVFNARMCNIFNEKGQVIKYKGQLVKGDEVRYGYSPYDYTVFVFSIKGSKGIAIRNANTYSLKYIEGTGWMAYTGKKIWWILNNVFRVI